MKGTKMDNAKVHDVRRSNGEWRELAVAAAQIATAGDEFLVTAEEDADFVNGVVFALRGHLQATYKWGAEESEE
jgi:hypothetical protein